MNLQQFLDRWPAKDSRLFLIAGGKDHDRLSLHQLVADHWRKKVDPLDVARLHEPTFANVSETLRRDPLTSKYRVVIATELQWDDPQEPKDKAGVTSLTKLFSNWPRDVVLVASTPELPPDPTKNELAQAIIRKGYWVAITNIDEADACGFLSRISGWDDEELVREVVHSVGTSPALLLSFLRTVLLAHPHPSPENVHTFLSGSHEGTVFDLVEAIIMKDETTALELASHPIPTGQVIGALDRKLTSLLQFMAAMKRGASPKEAAWSLNLPGFIVHGLYEASKRWTGPEIIATWPKLAELAVTAGRPASNERLISSILLT